MLHRLCLSNFKCWETAELSFGKITGLFGVNSSGKTSFGQLLLLLKQTQESTDRGLALQLNGRFVRLGAARDVIFGHHESRILGFKLEFEGPENFRLPDGRGGAARKIENAGNRSINARLAINQGAFRSTHLSYGVGNARFELVRDKNGQGPFALQADTPEREFFFRRSKGRPPKLGGPVKSYRFPDSARIGFLNSSFLSDLEAAFESALNRFYYLGPLREVPGRDYLWERSQPADIGEKGERSIAAVIASQAFGINQNLGKRKWKRPLAYILSHWFRHLSLLDSFEVAEIAEGSNRFEVSVRAIDSRANVLLTDVGFGVAQVLPVLTLLHYVPEGSTVLIEQPELHLHPLAQAELADVIIHAATYRRVQVIVESHSEHLLLRLQRRIAETARGAQSKDLDHVVQISAEDVRLYFCRRTQGRSQIEELTLDEYGSIRNWPHKFLGDAFSETVAARLAALGG